MPLREFKKTKRILTSSEQQTLREQARANAQQARLTEAEKEQLVREGMLRKIVLHPDPKTTIVRYEPVEK